MLAARTRSLLTGVRSVPAQNVPLIARRLTLIPLILADDRRLSGRLKRRCYSSTFVPLRTSSGSPKTTRSIPAAASPPQPMAWPTLACTVACSVAVRLYHPLSGVPDLMYRGDTRTRSSLSVSVDGSSGMAVEVHEYATLAGFGIRVVSFNPCQQVGSGRNAMITASFGGGLGHPGLCVDVTLGTFSGLEVDYSNRASPVLYCTQTDRCGPVLLP
jgi:hypothetical protein